MLQDQRHQRRSIVSCACSTVLAAAAASGAGAEGICSSGSCAVVHASPGCSNLECCKLVCKFNPICCELSWDETCLEFAEFICLPIGICGLATAGSCFAPHANPACEDAACCEKVCAVDQHCCSVQWDFLCAQRALLLCSTPGECGTATGPCNQVHPTGGCADQACCELVCGLDPHCCQQAWDFVCVATANCYCYGGCNVICPANGFPEFEPCGQKTNDPCYNPGGTIAGQALIPGLPLCARLFVASLPGGAIDADVDVFVAQLGSAGSGLITATLKFRSKKLAWAALLPAPPIGGCPPLEDAIVHVQSFNTIEGTATICTPAGKYWVVTSAGTFPQIGQTPPMACAEGLVLITVSFTMGCAAPCGNPELPCFLPHGAPGCGDPAGCCPTVCSVDPFCCAVEWDNACAVQAHQLCDGVPPPNDDCAEAISIGAGATFFSTMLAATDGPPLPASCSEGGSLQFTNDIWFRFNPATAGLVRVSTCHSATFDTRLAIYEDACPPQTLLACNDDDASCSAAGRSSTIQLNLDCDRSYLIRVGGKGTQGVGTLLITELGATGCACDADLDGSGLVDGADLGLLLGQWGLCGGCPADLDGSGVVDGADLGAMLGQWGPC